MALLDRLLFRLIVIRRQPRDKWGITWVQAKETAPKPVSPFTPSHYLTWAFISMAALGASAALPQQTDALRTVFLLASTCKGYLIGVALPPPLKILLHPIVVCSLYTTACCHLWASVSGTTYASVLTQFMAKVRMLAPDGQPHAYRNPRRQLQPHRSLQRWGPGQTEGTLQSLQHRQMRGVFRRERPPTGHALML